MKERIQFSMVLVALCALLISGCSATAAASGPDAAATEDPQIQEGAAAELPNPASVFCNEQGGTLDIRTDDSGSTGFCVFEDGSECEEWAFFRGECRPEPAGGVAKLVYGWYGLVITPPAGQPFDYYLSLYPKEAGNAGLVPLNDEVEDTLAELRDSGQLAYFWGALDCEGSDFSGCRMEVTRVRPEGPGEFFAPDLVEGWSGTIQNLPDGAQYDDVFIMSDAVFPVQYGIDAKDATVAAQLETVRDTGRSIVVFGELSCGVIDVNGCQIQVSRTEGAETTAPTELPESTSVASVNDWVGLIKSTPDGAQFDDYFEKLAFDGATYGIDAKDEALRQQIVSLRDSEVQVHIWGKLVSDAPDYGTHQIMVTRLEVEVTPEAPEIVAKDVDNWVGVVVSTPDGAQFDDCFERRDLGQVISFGIDSMDLAVRSQIEALRDSDKIVHLHGTLLSNVPDCNGSQIQVDRIEVEE